VNDLCGSARQIQHLLMGDLLISEINQKNSSSFRGRRENDHIYPTMPPNLKRNTTVEIEAACDCLQSVYANDIYELGDEGCFGPMTDLKSHHYFTHQGSDDSQISSETMKHIFKEVTQILPKQLEALARGSMFVRYDDVCPQYLRACLTGVEGTPYASGIFIFDIYLPPSYPNSPCLVKHVTKDSCSIHANNGPGGFSPNLHSDSGQVCLSLLGTWDGPGWNPKSSNVYQVLSSILWMILGALHPYYMEPGFGGWEGNAPSDVTQDPG
jgi:ubiquitin-protein ligase